MKRVLVAIHFSEQSLVVFKYAMKLAQYFGSTVDLAHVLPLSQISGESGKYFDQIRAERLQNIKLSAR